MRTREIARDEWERFFDSFSRQHQGWLATIEVFGPDIGAQVEARELPFEGITAVLKGSGADMISIITGELTEEHLAHNISAPVHVRLEESEEGAHLALEIESAAGVRTLLQFRSAVLPEMVDGIVTEEENRMKGDRRS